MVVQGIRRMPVAGLALVLLVAATPAASATFPAANGLIVTQAETDDGTQLFTVKREGTELRQVTHVEPVPPPELFLRFSGASRPDGSPDGHTVVHRERLRSDDSDDSSPEAINITTVAPEGTGMRYLTDVKAGSQAHISRIIVPAYIGVALRDAA